MSFATPNKPPAALNPGAPENINHLNANFLAIENVLDEGITYKDHFEQSVKGLYSHLYNAADFGTYGTGAAIQATIDQAEADGGGVVYIPLGDWTVNDTIQLPPTALIRLQGAGRPPGAHSAAVGGTRLVRSSGTNTMLQIGDGTTTIESGTLSHVSISDLELRGGGLGGYILDASACSPLNLHRVNFVGSNATGVRLRQVWNSTGSEIDFRSMGANATPAVLLGGLDGASQPGCDTILWSNVLWEGNAGTSLKITGDSTHSAGSNCNALQFTNVKFEANTGSGNYINLDYAQACKFVNANIACADQTGVPIKEAHPFSTTNANQFAGLQVLFNSTGNPAYAMQLSQGSWVLSNVNIVGNGNGPTTAGIKIDSAVATGRFRHAALLTNLGGTIPELLDSRAAPSVASAGSPAGTITLPAGERVVSVTGTSTVTTITADPGKPVVTLTFPGTASAAGLTDGSNLKLAGDFGWTPNDTITLYCDGSDWFELSRSVN